MSQHDKKSNKLASQQTAVMSYLEDLLLEVPPVLADPPDNVKSFPQQVPEETVTFAEPLKLEIPVTNIPEGPVTREQDAVELEEKIEGLHETPAVEEIVEAVEDNVNEAAQTPETVTTQEAPADQRPAWVEQEFQCLMFNVVGISLAVPLVKLNGVIPWTDELTPMPGHSEAFLGLLRHLNKNVKVMDTATVILPVQQRQQIAPVEERMKKIILMDEGRWGLACDDVGEVITLKAEQVRWRTAAGRRPWLAGTIPDRLCALLDTEVLARQLADGQE